MGLVIYPNSPSGLRSIWYLISLAICIDRIWGAWVKSPKLSGAVGDDLAFVPCDITDVRYFSRQSEGTKLVSWSC